MYIENNIMIKIIVSGSRDFTDKAKLYETLDKYLLTFFEPNDIIVKEPHITTHRFEKVRMVLLSDRSWKNVIELEKHDEKCRYSQVEV
tara:strand:- start:2387 stop:2650 length:264 start_codon:yes stop_codon:yes gene_type:complete